MNRILLFLFLSMVSLSQLKSQELLLASDVWPPFTNVEDQKRIAIDIVSTALGRISIDDSVVIEGFNEVINGIQNTKYDGSAALWYSKEREEELIFSTPYLYNQLVLVGRKGSDVSATSFSDLSQVKIGVVENYAYGNEMKENESIEILKGISDQKNLEKLLSKKVDYILVDDLLLQYLLKYQTNDVSEFLEIGTTPLIVKPLHFALSKKVENAEEIMDQFNAEILSMKEDGSFYKILELNWIRTDVDGDGKMELVLVGEKAGIEAPKMAYNIDPSQTSQSNEGFYIQGEYYISWDQVPDHLKVNISEIDNSNYHEGGIILKF